MQFYGFYYMLSKILLTSIYLRDISLYSQNNAVVVNNNIN